MLVAITGTPATGKTTIARIVGKKLSWTVIELNKLASDRELYSGYDEERKCHVVDIEKVRETLGNIEARNMIIESHYAHEMESDLVVVLRANPDEIRKRAIDKGWDKKKIEENVLAEIMEVCKQEAFESGKKVFEVDTTGKEPKKVADEVILIIEKFSKFSKS